MNDLKDLYFKPFIDDTSLKKIVKEKSIQFGFVANIVRSSVSEVSYYCHKGDNPKYKKKNGTYDDRCGCKWTLVAHPYNIQVEAISSRIWIVDHMPGEHNHSLNRPKHEDCTTPVNEIKDIEADITVDKKINIKESNQVDIEEIIDDINENSGSNTKVDYKASENKQDIKEETKEKNSYSDIKQKKLFIPKKRKAFKTFEEIENDIKVENNLSENLYGFPKHLAVEFCYMGGDGHCGFHSVAKAVYNDAEKHMQVRKKMMNALDIYSGTYLIENQPYSVSKLRHILSAPDGKVMQEYYFNLPDCAQLASEVYQRPLVVLEEKQNYLFVPLLTPPWSDKCEHNPIVLKHFGLHYNALITMCDSSSFLNGASFILNQSHSARLKAKAKGKSRALSNPTYQYFNDDWKSIFPTCFKINIEK